MILIVLSAILGAWLGLTRPGKISAMLVSGVIVASSHVVLDYLGQLLVRMSDRPTLTALLVDRLGLGEHMGEAVGAAMLAAAAAGLLAALARKEEATGVYLPNAVEPKRRRRRPEAESDGLRGGTARSFGSMLNR